LSESAHEKDVLSCSDGGLIMNTIETKMKQLQVIEQFMKWAGLQRALVSPQGIEFEHAPSGLKNERVYSAKEFINDLQIKLVL
jgi:hypothetical protein